MTKFAASIFTPQPEDSVRMIFVEDPSARAVQELGSYLQLNPEFFEQHLNRSGFHAASYQDPLPQTWNTISADKDYFSLRWFRPILRNKQYPPNLSDRAELLHSDWVTWVGTTLAKRKGRPDQTVGTQHRARCDTNILRPEWNLSATSPAQYTTSNKFVPCSWEERATVYRTSAPANRRLGMSSCTHIVNVFSSILYA